jgi:YD repeat-containing protein
VAGLKQKNISSVPVEQSSYIIKGEDEFLLSSTLNSYKTGIPVIDTILLVNLEEPLPASQFAGSKNSSGTFLRDALYKPEYIFPLFDNKGNVLMQQKVDDVMETILWGYDAKYPIARIIGSDYSTVSGIVDMNILNNPASDLQLRTEIQKIRTHFADTTVQVMNNTYLYGVGVSSETDAKGITTFYEYDSFNRLKVIRRHDGNIIKMFDYKIKSSD